MLAEPVMRELKQDGGPQGVINKDLREGGMKSFTSLFV